MADDPLLLGIEIGGTKLQLGLGRGDGRIARPRTPRRSTPARGAEGILRPDRRGPSSPPARPGPAAGAVAAVGIGFGGPVDSAAGVVTRSHQVAGWDGFPLADWVRERPRRRRASRSRTTPTPPGWARPGSAPGVGASPVLYVTIGSGIGGGLILDGRIYRGAGAGPSRSATSGSSTGPAPTSTS